MSRVPASLCALLLIASCNSREQQCDRLVTTWNNLRALLAATTSAPSKSALDQTIFGVTRARSELAGLELPDADLDRHRRELAKLLDTDVAALRTYAEVSANHDAADAEELRGKIEALLADERRLIDAVNRDCRAAK